MVIHDPKTDRKGIWASVAQFSFHLLRYSSSSKSLGVKCERQRTNYLLICITDYFHHWSLKKKKKKMQSQGNLVRKSLSVLVGSWNCLELPQNTHLQVHESFLSNWKNEWEITWWKLLLKNCSKHEWWHICNIMVQYTQSSF